MKFFLILACIIFCSGNSIIAKADDKISLGDIISKLVKIHLVKVIGWDRVQGIQETIVNADDINEALADSNILKLQKAIDDSTDYRCLTGKDYLVIVPKSNPARYNTPVSMRMMKVPEAKKLSQQEFFKLLQPASGDKGDFTLKCPSILGPQITEGVISTKPEEGRCYEVLNKMARQLNARSWIIAYTVLVADDFGVPPKTDVPEKLNFAEVSFFHNNEN
jgi:hypothetical protein